MSSPYRVGRGIIRIYLALKSQLNWNPVGCCAQGDVLKTVTHFTQCGKGLYDPDLLGNTIAFMIVQMQ